MNQDFVELKIPAKPEYVGVVRLLISGVASRFGFSMDDIEDIKLAVAEACTNATLHAYEGGDGKIIIGCTGYDDRLEIMVMDHGQSFDLEKTRLNLKPIDHTQSIDSITEGGLGLFLIESLMDDVQITGDGGVVISMTKFKRGNEVESDEQSFKTTSSQ
ncbi:anti-sigma B factor RsbW [Bacillus horti]|uniref:Serine-protein kinase RsbW n=1 Tax=Caldalkalibacillus horti TaxID=77523 RepID=A0ABT9W4T1_9BACI|nr:anti-sigma B factor RsbW [Bacillus horti]MDQ0168263.1 serine/threonine-protein kinase RsbW [Bacillus horti]